MRTQAMALTALEVATSLPIGGTAIALPDTASSPREALDDVVRTALLRPPCLVSFSGGRDSSAVLAVATALARREGHPLPIPITKRYPGIAEAEESRWQQLVVDHLKLPDWTVLEFTDELDLLGDIAMKTLREHGLLWPPNAYLHVPLLAQARAGSLLTGLDGDGLLGGWRWARVQQVLGRKARPEWRDLRGIGYAVAPRAVRRSVEVRRAGDLGHTWLRPDARAGVNRGAAADSVDEPRRWDARLAWYAGRRYLELCRHSLRLLATDVNVAVAHPLNDNGFLASLAHAAPAIGLGNRTAAMQQLFGDLLPDPVVNRGTKATFREAIFRERSTAFVREWDGTGVDPTLVDAEALHAHWLSGSPHFGSLTLLQSLAARR